MTQNPWTIRALLLDADGVVQRAGGSFRGELARLIDPGSDLDAFIADVVAAEKPCLIGAADFAVELTKVLERWQSRRSVADALSIWTNLIVDESMIDTVGRLRDAGLYCCLATNQHAQRAAYMSEQLSYGEIFDQEFYSCRVGRAKPDAEYFERVLAALQLPAHDVLFVDDHESNTAAARDVGINAAHIQPNAGAPAFIRLLDTFGVTTRGVKP